MTSERLGGPRRQPVPEEHGRVEAENASISDVTGPTYPGIDEEEQELRRDALGPDHDLEEQ